VVHVDAFLNLTSMGETPKRFSFRSLAPVKYRAAIANAERREKVLLNMLRTSTSAGCGLGHDEARRA
jgi:hypothetical protein